MKNTFIKLITAASLTLAAASARADSVAQSALLNTPAALSLSTAGSLTDPASEGFAAASILSSPAADLGTGPLNGAVGFAASPGRTWETFAPSGPKVSVPLPEPSSGTALYFLSGVAGLALVVLRRRTLA